MPSKEFDNYIIYHQHRNGTEQNVTINCYLGNNTVGYILFYDGIVPDPEVMKSGALKLAFHYNRFSEIINTIRYEKPLYISIYGNKSMVSTVREPVGEQEGHH